MVAAALPAPLRARSPADIPASLSARVFNEEINADPGDDGPGAPGGALGELGKRSAEATLFVMPSPPPRALPSPRDAPGSPGCAWAGQARMAWAGVAWAIAQRLLSFAKTAFSYGKGKP